MKWIFCSFKNIDSQTQLQSLRYQTYHLVHLELLKVVFLLQADYKILQIKLKNGSNRGNSQGLLQGRLHQINIMLQITQRSCIRHFPWHFCNRVNQERKVCKSLYYQAKVQELVHQDPKKLWSECRRIRGMQNLFTDLTTNLFWKVNHLLIIVSSVLQTISTKP